VAHSARKAAYVTALLAASWSASGCAITTTQEKDARLAVKAERTVFNAKRIKFGHAPDGVKILGTSIVRSKGGTAIAVDVRNDSANPVNDLPLAVGVQSDGKKQYLNLERGTSYFEAHIPSLAAGAETTWVFSSKKEVPAGEPFARFGEAADPPLTVAESLPSLEVTQTLHNSAKGGPKVDVEVVNDSDIPQYEIQLYAWAKDGDQLRAAGTAKVSELDGGDSATVHMTLDGDPGKAPLEVSAPPTIFQ
jgi:hypothetical protein